MVSAPTVARPVLPAAIERALPLLKPSERPRAPDIAHGWLELLGDADGAPAGPTQRLMRSTAVAAVYERWWRPAWGRLLKGPLGPGTGDERRLARLLLGIAPGDGVLDVACGPGNFTRDFGRAAGPEGLVVGIDASRTMLARAVRDTAPAAGDAANVAYVRGDAVALPFRDASFDAVCCFAALHMFADPFAALDDMARVLTPGGRIAILTSCGLRSAPARAAGRLLRGRGDMRMFGRDEITRALAERGFAGVRQRVAGVAQLVGGRSA